MLLEVKDITKRFYGVTVLDKVNMQFNPGEVHALVGENGAGKSTLIKIIGGTYHADGGSVLVDGQKVEINTALDASSLGISIVYQEYNLVKNMTVLENVMLGKEPKGRFGSMDLKKTREHVEDVACKDHITVDLDKYAGDLSSAEAKIAEILRACTNDMKFLVLDEPTAALDDDDVSSLFTLIKKLKARGVGIIYISHRLEEIFEICDKASVLKDGKYVGTWETSEIDRDFLVTAMVGREITDVFPIRKRDHDDQKPVIFSAKGISDGTHFHDISFELKKGEILGIGGMSGHGQREMIRSLFGVVPLSSGSLFIEGEEIRMKSPADAIKYGLAFLSDDRRSEGLAQEQSVARNITYPTLKRYNPFGIIRKKKERARVSDLIEKLNIKLASQTQNVQNLSGGNQQRVVLAKWLPLNPSIMLFHEPTLGVDVGAKVEIYEILDALVSQGISIIMVTSDMLELLHLSDRICVFYEGEIIAEYRGETATEELIMSAASGKPAGQEVSL